MTYNEARAEIIQRLTRVGSNRISGEDAREAVLTVLDFAAAIDTSQGSGIPDWNADLTFQTDGTDAGRWCTHPDANGKKRIFETKVDDNTGNEPPTDPEVTENSFWEEISPSAGSGITEWTPGLYQSGLVIVYHNHSTDGSGLYKLVEAERPFNSSNIETEITGGKWERMGIDNLAAVLAHSNDAGNKKITNLADPVDPQDAATKAFVLASLTAVGRPRGGFDASAGTVPGPSVEIQQGDFWRVTVAGTIGNIVLQVGDVLFADKDEADAPEDFFAVQSNVDIATSTVPGLTKLYPGTNGDAEDGAPTQHAVNTAIGGIQQDQETLKIYKMSNFGSP